MSILCPKCASTGECIFYDDTTEIRRCRQCGHEWEILIDVDKFPYPDDWGEADYPEGGRTCPHCGSTCTQMVGAASAGDGDVYDEWHCSTCGDCFAGRTEWYDEDGQLIEVEE